MSKTAKIQAIAILGGMLLGALYGMLFPFDADAVVEVQTASAVPGEPPVVETVPMERTDLDILKWFGDMFLGILKFLIVPVIVATMVVAMARIGGIRKLGGLGGRTAVYFVGTTLSAVILGLVLFLIMSAAGAFDGFQPEEIQQALYQNDPEALKKQQDQIARWEAEADKPGWEKLTSFIDNNLIPGGGSEFSAHQESGKPMSNLSLILLALIVGAIAGSLGRKAQSFVSFFQTAEDVVIRLVILVMWIAPFGVFGLAANLTAKLGVDTFGLLGSYMLTVIIGLTIWTFIVQPLLLRYFGKMPYYGKFITGFAPAMLTAFSTSSSAATLPVTIRCTQENLGVSERTSGFVLPLGATLNMNGTALFEAVAVMFIATVYSPTELHFGHMVLIALTTTLAAIGTVAVPKASAVTNEENQ